MSEIVETDDAPAAIGPYSQAVVVNGLVYTAGQIGLTPDGDFVEGGIEAETRQCLDNLSAVLNAAGSSLEQAVKVEVYLTDLSDYDAMNTVYAEYVSDDAPARTAVEVARLPRDCRVEIAVIAEQ